MNSSHRFTPARLISFGLTLVCIVLLFSAATVTAQGTRSRIAFLTADYDTREMTISLVDPVSGAVTPLVVDGNFFFPTLSPDGRQLAFMGEHPRSRRRNIYIINTDGTNLHPVVPNRPTLKPDGQVVWSPDSSQVIYGILSGGRPAGFMRANSDGSGAEERLQLPDLPGELYETWAAISPDGNRLAIHVSLIDPPYRQIVIMELDSVTPVTTTLPDGTPFDRLAWSPDGERTLLSALMLNMSEPQPLMLGNSDASNVEILLQSPPNYITSISWSPDGSQIAFTATEMSGESVPDGEVYVANTDGSGVRSLNIPTNVGYNGTSWSVIPDDVVLPSTATSFLSVAN
ncbi:MAG: PD40 domain-containing protein [Anaerolineae bacterium]|nr:PD40 domain-containing protein [Anaerolineae bacterium]